MPPLFRSLAACAALLAATPVARAASSVPPVLPVEAFFAADAVQLPKLSPTGRYLAWLQPLHDRANLVVLDRQTGKKARLTDLKGDFVSDYNWATADRLTITRQFLDGSGFSFYAVNADGSQMIELRKADVKMVTRTYNVIEHRAFDSKHILVEMDLGLSGRTDPYSIDLYSGRATQLLGNFHGVYRWLTDHRGVIRVGVAVDFSRGDTVVYYRESEAADWIEIERFATRSSHWVPLDFDGDNRLLWVRTNRGRDTAAIITYDPVARKPVKEILADPVYDAEGIIYSLKAAAVVGATIVREGRETQWLDPAAQQLADALVQALPHTRNTIVSRADDDSAMIILAQSDRDLGSYFLFDNKSGTLSRLFVRNDQLKPDQMAAMKLVAFEARDGTKLHGFLSLPVGREPAHLPLVLLPHDGQFDGRDSLEFNREVQFLANRGYAVLQVNYRGSSGYGVRFCEAGYRQWGRAMQDDLTDAVGWAVAQGIADPQRVAIYGTYYGGYAALMGLATTPQLYACGVAREAPVELRNLAVMQKFSDRDPSYQNYVTRAWGHPGRDADQLKAASPLFLLGQMRAPLLTAYHEFDSEQPLLIYEEYLKLEKELKKGRKAFQSVFIDNKPAGYNSAEKWYGFYRALDSFLAANLAAKHAP